MTSRGAFSSGVVIWAIDPFEGKLRPHSFEVKGLLDWAKILGARIQPVYALNNPRSDLTAYEGLESLRDRVTQIEKLTLEYLTDLGCGTVLKPHVINLTGASPLELVEAVIEYSEEVSADMIVVSSRGRKGFDRFIYGSFAESLLLNSKRPIYFLTHQNGTVTAERANRVLFPTDFSDHSKTTFLEFTARVAHSKVEIVLYHAVYLSSNSAVENELLLATQNYFESQLAWAKAEAASWIEDIEYFQLKTKVLIEDIGVTSCPAEAIVRVARDESVRFIAMASSSGRNASILFGSVANDLFRKNIFPVWICGPCASTKLTQVC